MKPLKYRKKIDIIEAMKWEGFKVSGEDWRSWSDWFVSEDNGDGQDFLVFPDNRVCNVGDYIIKNIATGEFYLCNEETFKLNYALVAQ